MNTEQILKEKVEQGFVTCFNSDCELRESCLRWMGRHYVSQRPYVMTVINVNHPKVGGEDCFMRCKNEPVRFAHGFIALLEEMPRKMGNALLNEVIKMSNRTYAYEYRNGNRPIPPSMQQQIIEACRQIGWQHPIEFDRYSEGIEW